MGNEQAKVLGDEIARQGGREARNGRISERGAHGYDRPSGEC